MPRRKRLVAPRTGQQHMGLVEPVQRVYQPGPGRPSKMTPERVDIILRLLKAGNTREAAAQGAQVDAATMRRWCAAVPQFKAQVEDAEHAAEVAFASRIRKAATEAEVVEHFDQRGNLLTRRTKYDWKAAAWWLERRRGSTWKPAPQQVDVSGTVEHEHTGSVEVNVTVWRPDEAWLAALARNERDLPPDVRIVSPAPDRPVPGPVLLPESVPAPPAAPAAGDVPEPADRP
jgi:hypothetical protein